MTDEPTSAPAHHCHAVGCGTATDPKLFMCAKHWRMVPTHFQQRIWATYRRGQESDKRPSRDYLDAARAARRAVAIKENRLAEFDREEQAIAAAARAIADALDLTPQPKESK